MKMEGILQGSVVAAVLTLFDGLSVGWSLGTVLSAVLTAATLASVCQGTRTRTRLERIAFLTWLYWGLSYVSNLIEAVYFKVIPLPDAGRSAAAGLGIALFVACLLEWSSPTSRPDERMLSASIASNLWWRIPLLDFFFVVTYLVAGIAIQPWIASFYRGRPIPSLGQLVILQFGRGLFDISCVLPIFYRWAHTRKKATLVFSCVFTVLCGWGPLLLPNQFLPDSIRFAHGVEMGASGIAFGVVAATLLLKPARPESLEDRPRHRDKVNSVA